MKVLLNLALLFYILPVFAGPNLLKAQDAIPDTSLYQREQLEYNGGKLSYRILYPENFDKNKEYPVILFLHGAGERGNDNQKQLTHGAGLFLEKTNRKKYPAIVIFPQCPTDSYWSNVDIEADQNGKRSFHFGTDGEPTKAMEGVLALVDDLQKKTYVNQDQIYLGGLSMGGMGTFELLRRRPNVFAAAFAICGGDNVENVKHYKDVPLWIFHGEDDSIVPASHSITIVEKLKELGSKPRFNLYPGVDHNSWDNAFAEPKLLRWLFRNKGA
ncbi:carboxylesterase family protein [Albibacterium indicum]|uniref:carboxylesterase family protein n=1 Tax=Albibacterium indicum TaxID=2292082 RepID=UPI000E4D4461|nr:prolyl oligopeptidase family serine peptidase [Pedobacter indicus]